MALLIDFAFKPYHHPNGMLSQFTYGNGLVRTVTLNSRQWPARVRDVFSSTVAHDFSYSIDRNGNLTSISDVAPGSGQSGQDQR